MANLKISQLPEATANELQASDPFPFADLSASETKKVTVKNLLEGGLQLIDDLTIPGSKIDGTLAAGSINTSELADRAVTKIKLADNVILQTGTQADAEDGAGLGSLWINPSDGLAYYWSGSWTPFPSGTSVVGSTAADPVVVLASTANGTTTLSAQITDSTGAGQFMAGPTAGGGTVGLRVIDGLDLPVATTTTRGAVSADGVDLAVDGNGQLTINNAVASSAAAFHVVQYGANGLITGGRVVAPGDLPLATATTVGVISGGADFSVSATGVLSIANSIVSGTHTKITYDTNGLITGGTDLLESDIPELPCSKITSGEFPTDRYEDASVTDVKLADYAVTLVQEGDPGTSADYHLGQWWLNPATNDLHIYGRGSGGDYWIPVSVGNAGGVGTTTQPHIPGDGISGSPFNGASIVTWSVDWSKLDWSVVPDNPNGGDGTTANALTAGDGITGNAFDGSTPETWSVNWGDLDWGQVDMTDFPWDQLDWNKAPAPPSSGGGGTTTESHTAGTGLTGDAFNGSAAVSWAVDETWLDTQIGDYLTTNNIGAVDWSDLDWTVAPLPPMALGDLTDVNVAGATAGQVLTYDGTNWAPTTVSSGGGGNGPSVTPFSLTAGNYLTGGTFDGSVAVQFDVDATDANTASKVVARDANGSFACGAITATGYRIDQLGLLP